MWEAMVEGRWGVPGSWASERRDSSTSQQVACCTTYFGGFLYPLGLLEAGETVGCRQRACHLREAGGCPGLLHTHCRQRRTVPSGVAEQSRLP